MSRLYGEALTLASKAHEGQKRKGHGGPFLEHPLFVAGLISHYGGNGLAITAGLVHDVLEDASYDATEDIAELGGDVLSVVEEVTKKSDFYKLPRSKQLETYVDRIENMSKEAALVTACDKLHNMLDLAYTTEKHGKRFLENFDGPNLMLWEYYKKVTDALLERKDLSDTLKVDLRRAFKQLERIL